MESILYNTRRPDISFYKDGRIDISSRLAIMLNLESGDVVDVAVCNAESYIFIRHKAESVSGRHEAQCYPTRKKIKCRNFRAYSRRLSRAMLDICKSTKLARLPVGAPCSISGIDNAVPIITSNNIPNYD